MTCHPRRGWTLTSGLLWLCVFATQSVFGQSLPSLAGGKPAASVPIATGAAATDPLGRDTPRASIRNFLESCHDGNYVRAAQYLDLSKIGRNQRTTLGPNLALQLRTVLDHDPHFELVRLDNTPQGGSDDTLPPDIDLLQSSELNGRAVPLYLEREEQNGVNVWLVSADSVMHIPELSANVEEPAFEKKIPRPLVTITFLGTPVWVWIALVLLAAVISAVSRLLSRLAIIVLTPVVKRFAKEPLTYRLETFTEPIRLLVSVAVFRACMVVIAPSVLLRDYILKLLILLTVFGAAAIVMRIVDVIANHVTSRLDSKQRALSHSVFPLGVRFAKICIFSFGVLVVLAAWGYNTGTILAGLGVGGLAVALAAQKTIENLFGGISVISDRPVLVGDFCQFGGQVGTVEDIGLRSTRIRTLDRTLVSIPNSQFSTMTLENYSRRDRMWFHPTLSLKRDTAPDQIRNAMSAVTKVLTEHPKVDPTDVPVRFTKITSQSFDLEIFSYVQTPDFNEYLVVQSELLLKILELLAASDIFLAIPLQESLVGTAAENWEKSLGMQHIT